MAVLLDLSFRTNTNYGLVTPGALTIDPYDHRDEFWSLEHVSDGGPDGGGCHRLTHFAGAADYDAGVFWSSSAIAPAGGWAEEVEYFIDFRVRHVTDFDPGASTAWGYKFFITNAGSGGDNRVMILHQTPHPTNTCAPAGSVGDPDVANWSIGRNITSDCTGTANPNITVTHGVWYDLQFSWIFGADGVARAKYWQNNSNYSSPDAERTSFSGGWPMIDSMSQGMAISGYVGSSEAPDENKVLDIQDFRVRTDFDSSFHAAAAGATLTRRRTVCLGF